MPALSCKRGSRARLALDLLKSAVRVMLWHQQQEGQQQEPCPIFRAGLQAPLTALLWALQRDPTLDRKASLSLLITCYKPFIAALRACSAVAADSAAPCSPSSDIASSEPAAGQAATSGTAAAVGCPNTGAVDLHRCCRPRHELLLSIETLYVLLGVLINEAAGRWGRDCKQVHGFGRGLLCV
jgi:hypothetical protein